MRSKDTKFFLSDDDIAFLSDDSIFRRKQQVSLQIMELFGTLEANLKTVFSQFSNILPSKAIARNGKISRGENYLGLPWIVLDYPATFSREGVFAFRTLFWWSHPFIFTFHLSGKYLETHLEALLKNLHSFDSDLRICINANQWEHHHEATNYMPLHSFLNSSSFSAEFFREKGFLKLSKNLELEQYPELLTRGKEFLEQVLVRLQ